MKLSHTEHQSEVWPQPTIGISACLLGERVRHNGESKKNDWILGQLSTWVKWIPVCPEVEMGLGVPRETMRLLGTPEEPSLIAVNSKTDYTDRAHKTIQKILERKMPLDAYIFKKDSPTCGLERVKIYGASGIPSKKAIGLYAQGILKTYPRTPMIEEGRLSDLKQRESFLIRLFCLCRFSRLPKRVSALQSFHQLHKLQLMAYDPTGYPELGKIAANSTRAPIDQVFESYHTLLFTMLQKPLTRQKYINAFQHILGYFKESLQTREKSHILELFSDYRSGKIPLSSISTLFNYLVRQHEVTYLINQSILSPYPREIILSDDEI